jgi:hypothetical protein
MRSVYHVSYANCTPDEPSPGWYVGSETSVDIEGDGPTGPFLSWADANEARHQMLAEDAQSAAIAEEDEARERADHSQFGVGS